MTGTLALIDYGSGNVHSAARALLLANETARTGLDVQLTSDPRTIRTAQRIVLPGVGHFATCIGGLYNKPGLVEAIAEAVWGKRTPIMGICVGMQVLAELSYEGGVHDGLGWIPGRVDDLLPKDRSLLLPEETSLVLPHMGWNKLILPEAPHPLMQGLGEDPHVYFVHSYQFMPTHTSARIASCLYGTKFTAAIAHQNISGTQFHPEKSQAIGQKILQNFLKWTPEWT